MSGDVLFGPIALFCIMLTLFFGALLDKVRAWGLPVPASIGMMAFGAILGGIAEADNHWRETLLLADFNATLILHVFLPVLIFDGSASLKLKVLSRVTGSALFMALPGTLMGAFGVAGLGVGIYPEWSFLESLLLGAVVAATDPVAVIAVLHDLDADPFVSVFVDSEAILNDGSAIVLFQIVAQAIEIGYEALTAGDVIASIFRLTLMPIPLGVGFGFVIHYLTLKSLSEPVIAATVQISGAYIIFYVSDHLCKTSGVLTLLAAGIYIARQRGRHPRSDSESQVRAVWTQVVWVGNTMLFALVGFLIVIKTAEEVDFSVDAGWKVGRIFILYAFLNVFRFFLVAITTPIINYSAELPEDEMTWERFIMLSFSGLRGGVGAALALAVLGTEDYKSFGPEFFLNVAGIVILSSLFNGWLAGPLVDYLRLNSKEIFSFYAFRLALQEIKHNMNSQIDIMKRQSASDPHTIVNWVFVRMMSVNRIENLTLHVEEEAKSRGSVNSTHTHIDAAASAAMKKNGKKVTTTTTTNTNNNNNSTVVAIEDKKKNVKKSTLESHDGDTPRNDEIAGIAATLNFAEAAQELEREQQKQQQHNNEPAHQTDSETPQRHQTSQAVENDASCSVFSFCKRCCKNNRNGSDSDDSDDEDEQHRKAAADIAVDDRDMGFGVNRQDDDDDDDENDASHYLEQESDDDYNNNNNNTQQQQRESSAENADRENQEEAVAISKITSEILQPSESHVNNDSNTFEPSASFNQDNNKNNNTNKKEGLPATKTSKKSKDLLHTAHNNIAVDRALREKANPGNVLSREVLVLKSAELKSLKLVSLLNDSKERHIMIPIVLRMIKRDLWRQYDEGLLSGTTVTAFSDFIDNRTRTGQLFTTEDVFCFIKQDSQLSITDKVERFLLPEQFNDQRVVFFVEAAVAFRTMMEHVKNTLPLLHAKQSNIIFWMGWAKLTHSCAVEHEREVFGTYPEVAVLVNSRRRTQSVLAGARAIVPQTAVLYGLSNHQKEELHNEIFHFTFDALVIKEKDSIIHRIRQDAFRAGQDEMKQEIEEKGTGSDDSKEMKVINKTDRRRTKIDVDAAHGKQLIELLKNTSIFYSATDKLIAEIVEESHAQLFNQHEPIISTEFIGFIIYGNISRLTVATSNRSEPSGASGAKQGQQQRSSRKLKRFHSGDFFGINSLIYDVTPRTLEFIAHEETHILWIPFSVANRVFKQDPRVRHHFIIGSAIDVIGPFLSRAYPFSALTSAQRRSVVNQAKVTRVLDPKLRTQFGQRDAVFILRGREVMPPSPRHAAELIRNNPHIYDKAPDTLVVAPNIHMLPEGYNGFFEEGTILIQLQDARLTSQRVPLTGMGCLDIANVSLDVAWTSFTETAKQRDAFEATDVLLQELHKYMHICSYLKAVIKKMIDAGVTPGGGGLKKSTNTAAAVATSSLLGVASTIKRHRTSDNISRGDLANDIGDQQQQQPSADEGDDALLVVRDCMDELAKHIRIWSLQKHQGNLNRLYVSHVLSAYFSLVVRKSQEWTPRLKLFVEESVSNHLHTQNLSITSASTEPTSVVALNQQQQQQQQEQQQVKFDWSNIDNLCNFTDLVTFMKENAWYSEDDLRTLNAWDRLNVEGNVATNVDIDEPPPALISATLHDSEKRTAIFHAKARAKLVVTALRDMPTEVRETINKQRLFGRARFQVSKGRSLPGGTSGLDVFAPIAQSERNSDGRGGKSPSSESDGSSFHTGVATERSASEFYQPDKY